MKEQVGFVPPEIWLRAINPPWLLGSESRINHLLKKKAMNGCHVLLDSQEHLSSACRAINHLQLYLLFRRLLTNRPLSFLFFFFPPPLPLFTTIAAAAACPPSAGFSFCNLSKGNALCFKPDWAQVIFFFTLKNSREGSGEGEEKEKRGKNKIK